MQIGFKENTQDRSLLEAAFRGNHEAIQSWIGKYFSPFSSFVFLCFFQGREREREGEREGEERKREREGGERGREGRGERGS
jgi:hypothetical protein